MWIQTQNRQRIVNTDQIIDIFVDKTGKIVYAETTRDGDFFVLGEYQDRDICLKVMSIIVRIVGNSDATYLYMPLGGEANEWCEKVDHELTKVGLL